MAFIGFVQLAQRHSQRRAPGLLYTFLGLKANILGYRPALDISPMHTQYEPAFLQPPNRDSYSGFISIKIYSYLFCKINFIKRLRMHCQRLPMKLFKTLPCCPFLLAAYLLRRVPFLLRLCLLVALPAGQER